MEPGTAHTRVACLMEEARNATRDDSAAATSGG
jgi:hypothetical protein